MISRTYNSLTDKQKLVLRKFDLVQEIHANKLTLRRLEKRLENTKKKIKELEKEGE